MKTRDTKGQTVLDKSIEDFIELRECSQQWERIPVTIRLDIEKVAVLDHLCKRWEVTRSNLASQLLDEIIPLVLQRVYADKTSEEFYMLKNDILQDFEKKRKLVKKGKNKE